MPESTLDQAQRLVDQLTPYDQVQLLAYLASRLARVVPTQPPAPRGPEAAMPGRRSSSWGRSLPLRTPRSVRR